MNTRHRGNLTGGLILIVIGLLFLLNNLIPEFDFGKYWPLILVAIGVSMLLGRKEFHHTEGEQQ
ncbi:MAG TPA: DUF5668 domain-containing protein [Candidatus Kapabacteria bacterium]|nr:DUF5668 domain-containing protein [Candidatus Kapabacteria bacterium]